MSFLCLEETASSSKIAFVFYTGNYCSTLQWFSSVQFSRVSTHSFSLAISRGSYLFELNLFYFNLNLFTIFDLSSYCFMGFESYFNRIYHFFSYSLSSKIKRQVKNEKKEREGEGGGKVEKKKKSERHNSRENEEFEVNRSMRSFPQHIDQTDFPIEKPTITPSR